MFDRPSPLTVLRRRAALLTVADVPDGVLVIAIPAPVADLRTAIGDSDRVLATVAVS